MTAGTNITSEMQKCVASSFSRCKCVLVIFPDARASGFCHIRRCTSVLTYSQIQMCFCYFPRCKKCLASCFSRCKCALVISPDAKVCGFKCFSCCRNFLWQGRRQSWSLERIFNQPFTSLVNFPRLRTQIELISIVIKHGSLNLIKLNLNFNEL